MNPRVVLGMTLFNNARHLREATDSLLAQTYRDFALIMLDDASEDDTERISRDYEKRDSRIRYVRHPQRQGMVPTWREVVERASRDWPDAQYFAWVSDHDRWHRAWLEHHVCMLDAHPEVVLAYPLSPRIDDEGREGVKDPRSFDTFGVTSVRERWSRFCLNGVGSGDMVYGLMRLPALQRAGIFRSVLRPDRLLIAELTLQGEIRQVDAPLWFRRQSSVGSVARQRTTLFAGAAPRRLALPAWMQHAIVLMGEYGSSSAPVRIPFITLSGMVAKYVATYGWRHVKKTETAHRIGRGVDNAHWVKKVIKKAFHVSVYWTLVTARRIWGLTRRQYRRALYETLVLTHRLGLRGGGNPPR